MKKTQAACATDQLIIADSVTQATIFQILLFKRFLSAALHFL